MKRVLAFFLMLLLVCGLALPAFSQKLPERRGNVIDDAAVLSVDFAADIDKLNDRSSAQFIVITRHFLGGADATQYAKSLFDNWQLGTNDVLLLLVIGEERYALLTGDGIRNLVSDEQINSLLSNKLRQPFLQERDYEGAISGFLVALAQQIARAKGTSLSTDGLFGTPEAAKNTAQSVTDVSNWNVDSWWQGFFSEASEDNYYSGSDNHAVEYEYGYDEDYGFSFGKLILIGLVLMFIVRRRKAKGKSGLGILGWLVAGKGLGEVSRGMRGMQRNMGHRPPRR